MRNIKLIMEYDGSMYAGWQRQKNAKTIQQVLETALKKVTGENIEVIGASRTDSGVHAIGYCANFLTDSRIPEGKFRDAINTKLPDDIVVLKSVEMPIDFHARYNSVGKKYCYTILNTELPSALKKNFTFHVKLKLNYEKMQKACKYFVGTHDFSSLKNSGSSVKTSVRTITDLHIEKNDDIIKIYCSADGFLYNMMRIIVGILVQVGTEKIEPEKVEEIIESKNRQNAGKSAPASGLCLMEVFY